MTYELVVNNLLKMFKQKFDDQDVTFVQMVYWVQVVANQLRRQYAAELMTGLFSSTFDKVTVSKDSSLKNRKFFDLPRSILDLQQDKGIEYITYNFDSGCCCDGPNWAQVFFQPIRPSEAHRLYGDPHEKPGPENPYFYRIGHEVDSVKVNRVYLLGVECVDITDVEIQIMSSLDPKNICTLTDEVPIPDSLINTLNQMVVEFGRFQFLIPKERVNEGADQATADNKEVPIISQPQQQTEQ